MFEPLSKSRRVTYVFVPRKPHFGLSCLAWGIGSSRGVSPGFTPLSQSSFLLTVMRAGWIIPLYGIPEDFKVICIQWWILMIFRNKVSDTVLNLWLGALLKNVSCLVAKGLYACMLLFSSLVLVIYSIQAILWCL